MARRPRQPSAEERALWHEVVKSDTPLRKGRKPPGRATGDPPAEVPGSKGIAIRPFELGARAETAIPTHDLAAGLPERLDGAALRMDKKAHRRLKAGKTEPEARIDLHGMTAERAHAALSSFLQGASGRGLRTVLVITGKGRRDRGDDPIPRPHGVLRHEVPRWLSLPPLSALVLQVVPAHRRHGGSGAYYVHLARRR